jgi:DNA-binding NtrC family response regulator
MATQDATSRTPRTFSCLILEDDESFAPLVMQLVRGVGGEPCHCATVADARHTLESRSFDLLLLDNHLPDGKVYDFFDELRRRNPDAPAIMITGASDLTEAISLTRNGLLDYLTKPVDTAVLERSLQRALLRLARREPGSAPATSLGESASMQAVFRQLQQAARHPGASVLVVGESGVGKDVAVRTLHRLTYGEASETAPYVAINCAAVPGEMFEAELFGAERGAYTGADRKRTGLVAAAQGGTLFLDEIGEVPLAQQAKLLRFLENREFRTLGGTESRQFSGRVITATNRDLRADVAAGRFREDLLFRIEVITIAIPPLRERPEDIAALTERVLADLASKYGVPAPLVKPEDGLALQRHPFPGNVRELRNILERSLLRTGPESRWLDLDRTWLAARGSGVPAPVRPPSLPQQAPRPLATAPATEEILPPERSSLSPLESQEYRLIRSTLVECRGGIRRAAAKLGLSPQALLRRLEKWPELRPPPSAD